MELPSSGSPAGVRQPSRRVRVWQPLDNPASQNHDHPHVDRTLWDDFLGDAKKLGTASGSIELQVAHESGAAVTSCSGSCVSAGQLRLSASTVAEKVCSSMSYRFSQLSLPDVSTIFTCRSSSIEQEDSTEQRRPRRVELHLRGPSDPLKLTVPANFASHPGFDGLVKAWLSSAVQSVAAGTESAASSPVGKALAPLVPIALASAASPALQLMLQGLLSGSSAGTASVSAANLPMALSGFGGFLQSAEAAEGAAIGALSTHVGLFSLTAAIMFIMSIRGLNKHQTSREGNIMGMLATSLGIASVLLSPSFSGAHLRFLTAFMAAGAVGYTAATQVSMEDMPQLVAGFHSFVGLAAVFAGFASYFHPDPTFHTLKALETFAGTSVGMLTFTGSVVAAGKLHGVLPGAPLVLEHRWPLNIGGVLGSIILGGAFIRPSIYGGATGVACLLANTAIWGGLGANMVLPIGGADMPVVVSLLNAFSGIATSAMGFMLSNNLLTITGALVASSGTLLSDIMCRGINRSMGAVLLGGFGVEDGGQAAGGGAVPTGSVTEVSSMGFVGMLLTAKRVVIVPGYGLAVARCQTRLAEIVEILRDHGVTVHFAIHPVAGRLPGHMNVLLAEADVPYDIVKEMDDIKPELKSYDVAIVVGANDIVNPATQDDKSSPIYGMPAIEVWDCKTCVVLKRSMATGYSGVDNPLFYKENVRMLFGDAKHSLDTIHHLLEENQDRISGRGAEASPEHHQAQASFQQEEFPAAEKVVGVIRERRPGEQRVSISPSVVPVLRRMGFSVLLEAGAGMQAGFTDDDYAKHGGVSVAESAHEVLHQADVILKVNEPLLDEVQVLKSTQTMVGFWNMYDTSELMEALGQSQASFVNLALVPRISRAQKLDALTSMANIAGYKAVLDAFNRLPRFSRSSVTACGAVPPARVFVIGAGVAGLSAIATAHSLGAKVFANDVREAVKEQVESLGAEFIPVDATGIAGEGAGGYAMEMGSDFKAKQLATYARVIPDMDIVVTTAMIPNQAAPELIPEAVVASMKRGSVIVDLAAQTGGNCYLTQADKTMVSPSGVTVIGETNYASSMAAQASELIGNNFAALLDTLGGGANYGGENWEDAVIRPATVAHCGAITWPPPPPPQPAAPSGNTSAAGAAGAAGAAASSSPQGPLAPPANQPPEEVSELIKWLQDHQHEIALGLGAAVVLGLGLGADIPEEELTHLGYFVLSLLIGHFTVAGVTPALHTPLISVTNAISGIIVVGGMLQLNGPLLSARVGCALAAVFLSSINIVGGFAVTQRMLEMFKEDVKR